MLNFYALKLHLIPQLPMLQLLRWQHWNGTQFEYQMMTEFGMEYRICEQHIMKLISQHNVNVCGVRFANYYLVNTIYRHITGTIDKFIGWHYLTLAHSSAERAINFLQCGWVGVCVCFFHIDILNQLKSATHFPIMDYNEFNHYDNIRAVHNKQCISIESVCSTSTLNLSAT